ncbi:MAG: 50S ribosomal protein L24 [Flavobacteriaceae bacterium]|nr:50S ribosomal protein L24 [Flavobacteriaceae bacterium]
MGKLKIKTGDSVIVTAGDHKGSEGKVLRIIRDKNKAIVEGVNLVKKHEKPSAANPQGGISEKEAPIHISNLSVKDPKSGAATRVGYKMEGDKKVRFAKKSNQVI